MKVLIINVSGRLASDGSRLISALLRRDGHQVSLVFMSRPSPMLYAEEELAALDPLLRQADVAMLSVYSSYAVRAIQLTDHIHARYTGMPVIWGGPHCVSVPEVGLAHADGVCFSEGDEAVPELVNSMERGADWRATPNFAFMKDGKVARNRVLPPFKDLDSLPYYDFSLSGHFLLDRELIPMTLERLKERSADYPFRVPTFYFTASRGCPYTCSYCNNIRYISLFGPSAIRLHSVERVISELEYQLSSLGFIGFIAFSDDDFLLRPMSQLEEFAEKYKKRIGIPFGVMFSARSYRRDKLDILRSAGLTMVQMGVQSASPRVLEKVFNRRIDAPSVLKATRDISLYSRKGVKLYLDFIIDNPYERRLDIIQTYNFIRHLHPSVKVNLWYLAYFPGTPLYDRARADGLIDGLHQSAFRPYTRSRLRYQRNWEMFLVLLARYLRRIVKKKSTTLDALLWVLGTKPVRMLMSLVPGSVFATAGRAVQ